MRVREPAGAATLLAMGHLVRVPLRGVSVLDARAGPYLGLDAKVPTVTALRAVPAVRPPAGTGPPVAPVLLVHGAWGLDAAVIDLADALAADGRAVLAPDMAGGRCPADPGAAAALLAGLDPDEAIRALAASVDAVRADPFTSGDLVFVVGLGGGAPLAAFLAVVRVEIAALVLAGGDPPDLPVAAWDGLEADALVLLGAEQDPGPAAAWAATLAGLGRRVDIETLPAGMAADDPDEPLVRDRIREFLRKAPG